MKLNLTEDILVRTSWGNRALPLELAAEQVKDTLEAMGKVHRRLSNWRSVTYDTVPEPILLYDRDLKQSCIGILERGQYDLERTPYKDGSRQFQLASRDDYFQDRCSLRFKIGANHSPLLFTRQFLSNSIVLQLPSSEFSPPSLLSPDLLLSVLRSLVTVWKPVQGAIMGFHANQIATNTVPPDPLPAGYVHIPTPPTPHTGWVVYLSEARSSGVEAPADIVVEKIPGLGVLWIAESERFDHLDATKVGRVAAIDRALSPLRKPIIDPVQ